MAALLLLGLAFGARAQNCDVDFPGTASVMFSAACGASPSNVTLGKNTNFGAGDVLTFDADVTISGNVIVNADGSGKIIIPAGVSVIVDGNFRLNSVSGGCTGGSPCVFEIVVNGNLLISSNFRNDLNTLVWSGTGTVTFDDKLDNSNSGCMQCGTGGCPTVEADDCADAGSGCSSGDFCATINACTNDTTMPTISGCPSNIALGMTGPGCTQPVNWAAPTALDNCSVASFTSSHSPGFAFPKGPTVVTYTAKDPAGNTATCSFTVAVNDIIPPVISGCPANITVNANASCNAVVNWTAPTFNDNCTGGTLVSTKPPGSTFSVGLPTTVTYTATDAAGNTATCSFTVTVNDIIPPVISGCPANITVNANASCNAVVNWTAPAFTDNCTGGTLVSTKSPGSTFSVGSPTTVTYSATDAVGNTSTCSFTVTVIDMTAPVFSNCPIDVRATARPQSCDAIVNWTLPTAMDNCGGSVAVSSSHSSGNTFPIGPTVVKYTATDGAGNTSQCEFIVMVSNESAPVIVGCPQDITVRAEESGQASVTWTEPTASVACGAVTLESTYNPGDVFPAGVTEVVYTAVGGGGENARCKFTVTVDADIQFEITQVVSPNGDGVNDQWELSNIENYSRNEVVVVDRWGNVIYKASGYNNGDVAWRGENRQGAIVPSGTYFYTIFVDFSSTRVEKRGFVEVVR